jgi:hypothetical protein
MKLKGRPLLILCGCTTFIAILVVTSLLGRIFFIEKLTNDVLGFYCVDMIISAVFTLILMFAGDDNDYDEY